ncbi:MAG: hypothetical protein A2X88_02210 [Deltaproteobacteria bacterium GWC2_65_14]|nr:MAG: hypothetical protein A2X88_02210 [Deltaproteobacteria bacterium GWC2_65_14]
MRRVVSGEREIDRCLSCGALWFDSGEIRELTEGRLPAGEGESPPDPPAGELARLHRQAASTPCPMCGERLGAVDFQMTGVPVLVCRECRGILAPRRSAGRIAARFRFLREHREKYAALGESLAEAAMRRQAAGGIGGPGMGIPLPVIVPLSDTGPEVRSFPVVTLLLAALPFLITLFAGLGEASLRLPGGLAGLPSGAGFRGIPPEALLIAPFLHAGLLPLAVGILFLLVLGDNVEDRMGWLPFLLLYLLCGAVAGAAHLLWGTTGNPPALGSAGAVAGVLGAYLVFFPDVPIRMYGLGRVVTIPAYLFACVWIAGAFLIGPGPFMDFLNPAPLSLAGNLAGFGSGVAGAILWRVAGEENPTGNESVPAS